MKTDVIIAQLDNLSKANTQVKRKNSSEYTIKGEEYVANLSIDPYAPSIELDVIENNKVILNYSVDSDLYDLSNPKFAKFGEAIINDIASLLENIYQGRVLLSKKTNKKMLAIPTLDGFDLIIKGIFFTTKKTYSTLEKAVEDGHFYRLR